jgi:hypothetical protein
MSQSILLDSQQFKKKLILVSAGEQKDVVSDDFVH